MEITTWLLLVDWVINVFFSFSILVSGGIFRPGTFSGDEIGSTEQNPSCGCSIRGNKDETIRNQLIYYAY